MNVDKFNSPEERDKRLKMRYSHPEAHKKMAKGFEKHNSMSKAINKLKK